MRHLLIDGDVIAYKAACVVEKAFEWEPGHWTWAADEMQARGAVLGEINHLMEVLDGDKFTLCLTDSVNFRKAILPTYKSNRVGTKKPLVLKSIRQWLVEEHGAKIKPGLEGDDVMGILATMNHRKDEERIIVSIDKDMKTVPGFYYKNAEVGLVEVSETAANWWHLYQTLTGDSTDGYSGCPGIGAKKAEDILGDGGSIVAWERVVWAYEKAGLDEHAALTQARVARILRASDYDFKQGKPILWNPPTTR